MYQEVELGGTIAENRQLRVTSQKLSE
jgi:hypothetical protein